jgi:hypothetical protein
LVAVFSTCVRRVENLTADVTPELGPAGRIAEAILKWAKENGKLLWRKVSS